MFTGIEGSGGFIMRVALAILWGLSLLTGSHLQVGRDSPVNIGSQLQLFLDRELIETMTKVSLRMHSPVPREYVFRFDAPWEGPESSYVSVMKDGDRFRMYYRGGGENTQEVTCYAESRDGIIWSRPSIGAVEYQGSMQNNIILIGKRKAYWESHNFAPFKDMNPSIPPTQRYKAVGLGRSRETGNKALVALISPDGIHWASLQEPPIMAQGSFDSLNTVFWDNVQLYVCYLRVGREGKRSIARCTSSDFIHWSQPELLDFGKTPLEQFYTNAITPYFQEPHIYLGLPMRFVPERKTFGSKQTPVDGLSDAVLISSHDGLRWSRTFMEAFIRPGLDPLNWGHPHQNNCPAWGIVPTKEGEISIYWLEHSGNIPLLRRGTLRTDGFASVNAPYGGGEFITRLLIFTGKQLVINYSTSAVGSLRVEIQNAEGKPIEGYTLADCPEIYGDELERAVSWKNGTDVSRLAGQPVRLRFVMKDADLYSIRFKG